MTRCMLGLALASALSLLGCPTPAGPTGTLPREETRRKLLQYQGVKFHQRQFFVGIAHGANLETATQMAYQEITRQLTWLPAGSQDLLRGMYRVDRSATDSEGNVHALAVLERDAATIHLRKLSQEADAAAQLRLADCRKLLRVGEVPRAQACLAAANLQVARARELLAVSRAAVGDPVRRSILTSETEAEALAKELSSSAAHRGSVLVHVLRHVDGQAAGDLDAEFAPLCTNAGLRRVSGPVASRTVVDALDGSADALLGDARRAGAGYALVGQVKATFASEESGLYYAYASGNLRVIETTGGRTVAEVSCQDVKGGHISRRQANDKAVKEAVARLKEELKPKLAALVGH